MKRAGRIRPRAYAAFLLLLAALTTIGFDPPGFVRWLLGGRWPYFWAGAFTSAFVQLVIREWTRPEPLDSGIGAALASQTPDEYRDLLKRNQALERENAALKAKLAKPPPPAYTEDVFGVIRWRWRWQVDPDARPEATDLHAFCAAADCDHELVVGRAPFEYQNRGIMLVCQNPACRATCFQAGGWPDVRGHAARLIERNLRTGFRGEPQAPEGV